MKTMNAVYGSLLEALEGARQMRVKKDRRAMKRRIRKALRRLKRCT